jgi:hypothetical protein
LLNAHSPLHFLAHLLLAWMDLQIHTKLLFEITHFQPLHYKK